MKSVARHYKPWGLHTVRVKLRSNRMENACKGDSKRLTMPMRYFDWKMERFDRNWSSK